MSSVVVYDDYQVQLPTELQNQITIGSRFEVSLDETGRIILTPMSDAQQILQETFGMWRDRSDIPADGVAYVNEIRTGERLQHLETEPDEGD